MRRAAIFAMMAVPLASTSRQEDGINRAIASVVLLVGVVLLTAGIRSSRTAASQLSELFNDRPTQETSILLATGVAAIATGAWWLLKQHPK